MNDEDFDSLTREVFTLPEARVAARENSIRRLIAEAIKAEMIRRGISEAELAKSIKISKAQMRRLLHQELGGNLHLGTICKALDALQIG